MEKKQWIKNAIRPADKFKDTFVKEAEDKEEFKMPDNFDLPDEFLDSFL